MSEARDNQQIRDDSQTSGESVLADQTSGDATQPTRLPNQAADEEPAEGSRENTGGVSNRPLDEERQQRNRVPPPGERKGNSRS